MKGADLSAWKGRKNAKGVKHVVTSHCLGGKGSKSANIMLIGEAPGSVEDREGEPFVGPAGEILTSALEYVPLTLNDVYITNAVKCRPPDNSTPTYPQSIPCTTFLAKEIEQVKPEFIVPLGATALRAVTGNSKAAVGTYVNRMNCQSTEFKAKVCGREATIFPMFHPAYVLRADHLIKDYYENFIRLAVLAGVAEDEENEYAELRGSGTYWTFWPGGPLDLIVWRTKMRELRRKGNYRWAFDLPALEVAYDIEANSLNAYRQKSRLCSIAFSDKEGFGFSILLDHDEYRWTKKERQIIDSEIRKLFDAPGLSFIAHNRKFDDQYVLEHLGCVPPPAPDTMLQHCVGINENPGHGLKVLAWHYTGMGGYEDASGGEDREEANWQLHRLSPQSFLPYNAMDVDATKRIRQSMKDDMALDEHDPHALFRLSERFMPRASRALMRMEWRGARVNHKKARQYQAVYDEKMEKTLASIKKVPEVRRFIKAREKNGKSDFSLNSTPQLSELLFSEKYFDYAPYYLTKKGQPSTDKTVLVNLIQDYKCDFCQALKRYRLDKIISDYLYGLWDASRKQKGFVHGNFNLHVAVTGRLSSSNPNLQNVSHQGGGDPYRPLISRWGGDGALLYADYSQVELRLLAAFSRDPAMLEAFARGEDLHLLTTCKIFGITPEIYYLAEAEKPVDPALFTSEMRAKLDKKDLKILAKGGHKAAEKAAFWRTVAKRVNFGIAYGIGGRGIAGQLASQEPPIHISDDEARGYIDTFYDAYPLVKRWIYDMIDLTEEQGFIESLFLRRRRLPEIYSENEDTQARARRQAVNHIIQSSASDMTLTALTRMSELMDDSKHLSGKAFPILTVHDSIVFDVRREVLRDAIKLLQDVMPNMIEHIPEIWGDGLDLSVLERVPCKADVQIGVNWRDMQKVGKDIGDKTLRDLLRKSRAACNKRDMEVLNVA